MNAVEIEEAVSQLVEAPFDRETFPCDFLRAFGQNDATIRKLKSGDANKSDMAGGVLQRNKHNIHLLTCAPGEVAAAMSALRASPATAKHKARFILATDGQTIQAERFEDGEVLACDYTDLPNRFAYFLSLAGISTVKRIDENAFDIRATGRLNKLYVELLKVNPDWDTEARRQDLNHFFARLIFCFFAEDTSIFMGSGLFTSTIEQMTERNGSNVHEVLGEIFRAMDTKPAEREAAGTRPYADSFPYVNGNLFGGSTDSPRFSQAARNYLIFVGNLDWKLINPDIFGSMIQAVADDEERGALGMHYTSVPNILKVLNPLFLDDLRAKLEEAGDGKTPGSARKLLNLRNRLARIRVFDPACGSGNFLVIAYKEMRQIEVEINQRRGDVGRTSEIPISNFRGIELRHFPAEIARLALIIAEFQCNVLFSGEMFARQEFLPLDAENWITCGNALRVDWSSVCPPTGTGVRLTGDDLFNTPKDQAEIDFENKGGETYICGNPPYKGQSEQTDNQKADLEFLFGESPVAWKTLDYVAGWFFKFSRYCAACDANAGFVSTNSIAQGQQVPALWPTLFGAGLAIKFARTSFKWTNLAAKKAGVTVVVIGLGRAGSAPVCLYSEDGSEQPVRREVPFIGPYLVPNSKVIVESSRQPRNGLPPMDYGSKPADGGGLVITPDEFLSISDSVAKRFIKPYVGSDDFIDGKLRYCLWVPDVALDEARTSTFIQARESLVRRFRTKSKKAQTRELAEHPLRFAEIRYAENQAGSIPLLIPIHTAEDRRCLPVGGLSHGAVVSNAAFGLYDAPLWCLALIASRLHLVWVGTVCGKIKTDYRYSNTFGWNTFPVPTLTDENKAALTRCAEDILLAREAHFPDTIADMYDPEAMDTKYPDLRAAHDRNDETLERIYIGRRFRNDTERLEKLFEMYTQMTAKGAGAAPAKWAKTRGN
ncbi:MAG TPA: lactate dehydrogenase [Phycisphaerales bacterium]|nr:lactate dehydrogenase [Phycisphaerales bacterium]